MSLETLNVIPSSVFDSLNIQTVDERAEKIKAILRENLINNNEKIIVDF